MINYENNNRKSLTTFNAVHDAAIIQTAPQEGSPKITMCPRAAYCTRRVQIDTMFWRRTDKFSICFNVCYEFNLWQFPDCCCSLPRIVLLGWDIHDMIRLTLISYQSPLELALLGISVIYYIHERWSPNKLARSSSSYFEMCALYQHRSNCFRVEFRILMQMIKQNYRTSWSAFHDKIFNIFF